MEGHAQARRLQHRQVVGAVAHAQRVADRQAALGGKTLERRELGLLAQDRRLDRAGQSVRPSCFRVLAASKSKPSAWLHQRREVGEAARHQRAGGAVLLHGGDQGGAARRVADAPWPPRRAWRPAGPSAGRPARSSAAAKSISPFMARAVMPAIFSRKPRKSASSSSISFSIMVDSMSATSSLLRRSGGRHDDRVEGGHGDVASPARRTGCRRRCPAPASRARRPWRPARAGRRRRSAIAPSFSAGWAALEIRTRTFFTLRL